MLRGRGRPRQEPEKDIARHVEQAKPKLKLRLTEEQAQALARQEQTDDITTEFTVESAWKEAALKSMFFNHVPVRTICIQLRLDPKLVWHKIETNKWDRERRVQTLIEARIAWSDYAAERKNKLGSILTKSLALIENAVEHRLAQALDEHDPMPVTIQEAQAISMIVNDMDRLAKSMTDETDVDAETVREAAKQISLADLQRAVAKDAFIEINTNDNTVKVKEHTKQLSKLDNQMQKPEVIDVGTLS